MELITLLLECATDQLPALLDSAAVSASLAHLVATSTLNSAQRQGLQQLITRLSSVPGTLSLPLLALYSYSYSTRNHQLVTSTIQQALESDSALAAAVQQQLPTLLQQSITHLTTSHPPPSYSQLSALLSPLLGLIRSLPPSYSMHFLSILPAITNFYSQYLPSLLPSAHSTPTEPYLSLKLDLLESTHSILSHSFLLPLSLPSLTSDERATLLTSLQPLLASSRPSLGSAPPKALISAPLLGDLERFYGLSSAIEQAAGEVVEEKQKAEVKEVVQRVIGAGERVATGKGGLEVLRRMRELDGVVVGSSTSVSKGKQKAVVSDPRTQPAEPDLTLPISQITDLFPDLSPSFLRLCLLHPSYSVSGAEGVIAALLEGTLPGELEKLRGGGGAAEVEVEEEQSVRDQQREQQTPTSRNNVFAEPLNAAQIRRGKERSTDLLSDRTFMTSSIKASIIARAEHESSDEDGEGEGQTEAFVEDYDTAAGGSFGVRDAGEGEEGEDVVREKREVDSGAGTPVNSGRSTPLPSFGPAVTHHLESTYISTPSLFDRSGLIRRSKERKQLREATGLGDEQIEGWRVMLERDPRKAKILAAHGVTTTSSTSSNLITTTALPQANDNHLHEAGPSSRGRGSGRGGSGGPGGGAGGGGRGGARGRGDGGRRESDRRQRGSDKKAALGRLA